ncbi:MAG TPA: hypothetical protein VJP87_13415 [Candidatus Acidoferrales bacterium]|nr:hypothetical protein [Candidatus Acidoferrales bacterium]
MAETAQAPHCPVHQLSMTESRFFARKQGGGLAEVDGFKCREPECPVLYAIDLGGYCVLGPDRNPRPYHPLKGEPG